MTVRGRIGRLGLVLEFLRSCLFEFDLIVDSGPKFLEKTPLPPPGQVDSAGSLAGDAAGQRELDKTKLRVQELLAQLQKETGAKEIDLGFVSVSAVLFVISDDSTELLFIVVLVLFSDLLLKCHYGIGFKKTIFSTNARTHIPLRLLPSLQTILLFFLTLPRTFSLSLSLSLSHSLFLSHFLNSSFSFFLFLFFSFSISSPSYYPLSLNLNMNDQLVDPIFILFPPVQNMLKYIFFLHFAMNVSSIFPTDK